MEKFSCIESMMKVDMMQDTAPNTMPSRISTGSVSLLLNKKQVRMKTPSKKTTFKICWMGRMTKSSGTASKNAIKLTVGVSGEGWMPR